MTVYDPQQGQPQPWITGAIPLKIHRRPEVSPGQQAVFADNGGRFSLQRKGRLRWKAYHLVDWTWHGFETSGAARSARPSWFRVELAGHWQIEDGARFLSGLVDQPETVVRTQILTLISTHTRQYRPDDPIAAQDELDQLVGRQQQLDFGLVVVIDKVTVRPPEQMESLVGVLDQGKVQADVDLLQRLLDNANQLNAADLASGLGSLSAAQRRDRGADVLHQTEEFMQGRSRLSSRKPPPRQLPAGNGYDEPYIEDAETES